MNNSGFPRVQALVVFSWLTALTGLPVSAQLEQNFDSDPLWTGVENTGPVDSFGFRRSNNTGHPSGEGEIGGIVGRDKFSFYADTSPFILFHETDELEFSGTFLIRTIAGHDPNQNVYIGYFSTTLIKGQDYPFFVGLKIQEPKKTTNGRFRLAAVIIGRSMDDVLAQLPFPQGVEPGVPLNFRYHYDPQAATMSLELTNPADQEVIFQESLTLSGPVKFEVEAFGLATENRKQESARGFQVFLDGLTYKNFQPQPPQDAAPNAAETGLNQNLPSLQTP